MNEIIFCLSPIRSLKRKPAAHKWEKLSLRKAHGKSHNGVRGLLCINKSFSTYELKVGHEGLSESNALGNQQLLQWMKFYRKEFPVRYSELNEVSWEMWRVLKDFNHYQTPRFTRSLLSAIWFFECGLVFSKDIAIIWQNSIVIRKVAVNRNQVNLLFWNVWWMVEFPKSAFCKHFKCFLETLLKNERGNRINATSKTVPEEKIGLEVTKLQFVDTTFFTSGAL